MSETAPVKKQEFELVQFLGENSKVLSTKIFSAKHFGRVADFYCFECAQFFSDENQSFKLRQTLDAMFFMAWSGYRSDEKQKYVEIEIGFNKDKAVLRLQFLIPPKQGALASNGSDFWKRTKEILEQTKPYRSGTIVRHNDDLGVLRVYCIFDRTRNNFETIYEPWKENEGEAGASNVTMLSASDKLRPFLVSEKKENQDFDASIAKKEDFSDEAKKEGESSGLDMTQVLVSLVQNDLEKASQQLPEDDKMVVLKNLRANLEDSLKTTIKHVTEILKIEMNTKIKGVRDEMDTLKTQVSVPGAEKKSTDSTSLTKQSDYDALVSKNLSADSRYNETVKFHQKSLNNTDVEEPAREWARGFMEDLIKDRGALNERVKAVDAFLRKREHEFRLQENGLQEQIRKKDEMLKQRDFMLKKANQILTNTIQEATKEEKSHPSEAELKSALQKLSFAEKNLDMLKKGTSKLTAKVEEMQKKLSQEISQKAVLEREVDVLKKAAAASAQKSAAAPGQAAAAGSAAKDQEAAHKKAIDELKQLNRELQTKAAQGVDTARQLKQSKDELDKYKKLYDDVKKAFLQSKGEISKLQGAVRVLEKKTSGGKS